VEAYSVHFLSFDSGEVTELFRKEGPFTHARLAVSPEEKWILYTRSRAGTSPGTPAGPKGRPFPRGRAAASEGTPKRLGEPEDPRRANKGVTGRHP
jgi:hypothetical protein